MQLMPGKGGWIAGRSFLDSVNPIEHLLLMAVDRDSVFAFGDGVGYRPDTLYVFTNRISPITPVHQFPLFLQPTAVLPTTFGVFVLTGVHPRMPTLPREVWKSDLTLTNWTRVFDSYPTSSNGTVLPKSTILQQGWDFDQQGNVYLGEYNIEDTTYPDLQLHIFKGTNYGENWSVAYTFPPRSLPGLQGGVRHIHACQVDPYSGYIWISTGDNNFQSRIYYHTNALLPDSDGTVRLKLIGGGSQEFCAVSFAFTEKYIYWFMDAPSAPQKVYRIRRASEYPVLPPNPLPGEDYRECITVIADKPFYYNRVVRNGTNNIILVASVFEDAAQYGGTFKEVDRWNRVFGIKEEANDKVQVQEIFAVRAAAPYAHFDPVGQNSNGEIFFSSVQIAGVNIYQGYQGLLIWQDNANYLGTNRAGCILSWTAQTNNVYQVLWANEADAQVWGKIGVPVQGDGSTNQLFYSTDGECSKFFKLTTCR